MNTLIANPAAKTPAEKNAMFKRLEDLAWRLSQNGCNRHEQVIALVAACIDEDLVTGPEIVGSVAQLGFNSRHVGKLLHGNIGHLWHRDGDRFYTALPPLN